MKASIVLESCLAGAKCLFTQNHSVLFLADVKFCAPHKRSQDFSVVSMLASRKLSQTQCILSVACLSRVLQSFKYQLGVRICNSNERFKFVNPLFGNGPISRGDKACHCCAGVFEIAYTIPSQEEESNFFGNYRIHLPLVHLLGFHEGLADKAGR